MEGSILFLFSNSSGSVFPKFPGRPGAKLSMFSTDGTPGPYFILKGLGDPCQEGPAAELSHLRKPVLKPRLRAGRPLATADWARCKWLTRVGLYLPPGNLKLDCWTGEQPTSAMCPEEQKDQVAGDEQRPETM